MTPKHGQTVNMARTASHHSTRPPSSASIRPPSSLASTRPPSSTSIRPSSSISQRPSSHISRIATTSTKTLPYTRTLITQITGLAPDDQDFQDTVDRVSSNFDYNPKAGSSVDLKTVDLKLKGLVGISANVMPNTVFMNPGLRAKQGYIPKIVLENL